jgi:hypothetical protein
MNKMKFVDLRFTLKEYTEHAEDKLERQITFEAFSDLQTMRAHKQAFTRKELEGFGLILQGLKMIREG